jgi:DNA polymerase III epsilon subunit-like protein
MFRLPDRPLVFVDTETDGLRPPWLIGGRQTWEIAVLHRPPDGDGGDALHTWMLPIDPAIGDPEALNIGGFYDRYQPDPDMWLPAVASAIVDLTDRATIVAANPGFDIANLEHLLYRYGRIPTWHHRPVCVEALAAARLGIADTGQWGLSRLAERAGLNISRYDLHTAAGDAALARDLFDWCFPA